MRVDLIRAYSKRSDLLEDLDQTLRRLARARKEPGERQSVSSTGRVGRVWSLQDRLTEAEVREIVAGFQAGLTKKKLAQQHGISESSVKRILRRHWIAKLMVEQAVA